MSAKRSEPVAMPKTIRQKIVLPVLIIAVVLPLAALLVFNIFMRFYLLQTARDDLKTTAAVMETLIRQQAAVDDPTTGNTLNATIKERLNSLRTAMRASRLTANTDLLVLDKDGQIMLPADPTAIGINTAVIQRIYNRLLLVKSNNQTVVDKAVTNQVMSIWTNSGQFLYVGYPLFPKTPNRTPVIIYLTRINQTSGFPLFINLMLSGIFLAGSIISILIARRTAASIENPLRELNRFADRIGHGDFKPEKPDGSNQEIAELYHQMNEMANRLNRADAMQKTFLQNASHEIRTPLMAIQGYAEGLISGIMPDTVRAASIIRDESLRLKTLVEELLTLSRIENRTGQLNLSRQNIPDSIKEIVARVQAIAMKDAKEIQLKMDSETLMAFMDDDLLAQAVTNLLTNAIRYARHLIVVYVGSDNDKVVIRIEDDGPGISESALPHLFDRFFKGPGGQFGLGLSIAQSAVNAMHGTLTASNRKSIPGAAFEIRLQKD